MGDTAADALGAGDNAGGASDASAEDTVLFRTMFKCDFCDTCFLNNDSALTHEAICGSRVQASSAAGAVADSVPFPSTMFKCEFCEIYFLNSDVASTHEAICGSRVRTISAADAIAASSVFDSVGSNAEMAIPIVDGGPGAATYADIGSLPVFDVKMSYNGSSKGTSVTVGDKDLCTICGEGFNGKKILALPKCRHFFCYECIVKWLLHKSNCPTCRATIKEE